MQTVSSRQNALVRAFRELAAAPPRDGSRLLLDGAHLIEEARRAGVTLTTVAIGAALIDGDSPEAALARALERSGVAVVTVTQPVLSALSPVKTPSGIVAIAERQPIDASAVFRSARPLVLAAADVQDPGNLGALVRVAEAMGATGALACGASANPFSWKALRGSMGSALRLPLAGGLTVDAVLEQARHHKVAAVAAVPRGGRAPDDVDWARPTVLFLGGEGPGLAPAFVEACDTRVTIPMRPSVESLNVAVAGALLLYEARRLRAS